MELFQLVICIQPNLHKYIESSHGILLLVIGICLETVIVLIKFVSNKGHEDMSFMV